MLAKLYNLKAPLTHPVFLSILALKLLVGSFLASGYLTELFIPFVNYYVESSFANPWEFFYQREQLDVFPYHPLMLWILTVPRVILDPLLSSAWTDVTALHLLSMRLPLVLADVMIYLTLALWFKSQLSRVLWLYWCSPIVFYICYIHGQLDIIPTALFFLSLYALKKNRITSAMVLLGMAFATKSHLFVALPFLFVYLAQDRSKFQALVSLSISVLLFAALASPYLFDPAFYRIVLQSDVQQRVFAYTLALPIPDAVVYLCPAALIVLFLRFAAYPKQNWDLTLLFLGLVFCSFVMLVPPMQGWFLWGLPFLVYFFCREEKLSGTALGFFTIGYLSYFLLSESSDLFTSFTVLAPELANSPSLAALLTTTGVNIELLRGVSFTLMQTSLAVLIFMIYRVGVRSNEVYGLKERSTLIGIAGDSGAGKDTLVGIIADIVGKNQLIAVSGDDYHRWERGDKNWKVLTHLDVRSNRLHQLLDHTIALQDGRSICKVRYSHDTGKFTDPEQVDPSKYVAVAGLHTFVLDRMRSIFDLKIFLDPDEELRRFWKARRDIGERGHSKEKVLEALNKRENDRVKHILPQRELADVVFTLRALNPISIDTLDIEPALGLDIQLNNSFDVEPLIESLRNNTEIEIEHYQSTEHAKQRITFRGVPTELQVERVSEQSIPNVNELSRDDIQYHDGINGLIQLVLLSCISSCLRWKSLTAVNRNESHARPQHGWVAQLAG